MPDVPITQALIASQLNYRTRRQMRIRIIELMPSFEVCRSERQIVPHRPLPPQFLHNILFNFLQGCLKNNNSRAWVEEPTKSSGDLVGIVKYLHLQLAWTQLEASFRPQLEEPTLKLTRPLYKSIRQGHSTRLFQTIWQGHIARPFDKATWQVHLTRPHDKAISQGHLRPFDKSIWQGHSKPFDTFDKAIWQVYLRPSDLVVSLF